MWQEEVLLYVLTEIVGNSLIVPQYQKPAAIGYSGYTLYQKHTWQADSYKCDTFNQNLDLGNILINLLYHM